jgi:hypothetical protein
MQNLLGGLPQQFKIGSQKANGCKDELVSHYQQKSQLRISNFQIGTHNLLK